MGVIKGKIQPVEEMSHEELLEHARSLEARIVCITDAYDFKPQPLNKRGFRNYLLRDIIVTDEVKVYKQDVIDFMENHVERMVVDKIQSLDDNMQHYLDNYYREAKIRENKDINKDINKVEGLIDISKDLGKDIVEFNKRSGIATKFFYKWFINLYYSNMPYAPTAHAMSASITKKGYKKDKGVSLYTQEDCLQCVLGLFPNEKLEELVMSELDGINTTA